MKRAYVRVMHHIRDLIARVGWMGHLDAWAARSRTGKWLRSMLAIYDIRSLVELDTPWWTFASADVVDRHLDGRAGARVFEWGSGASTVWLARRASHVIAIEHDEEWAERVRPYVADRGTVVTVAPRSGALGAPVGSSKRGFGGLDFTDYVAAIDVDDVDYDVIVIDGRAREACLVRALDHLADDGLIVFDNVDRRRYREAISATKGIRVEWTRGLTPALPYPTRTALIRRVAHR